MLFGCPDVLRFAYRAIRKGAFGGKSRSDKPNIERVVGIIREMRQVDRNAAHQHHDAQNKTGNIEKSPSCVEKTQDGNSF